MRHILALILFMALPAQAEPLLIAPVFGALVGFQPPDGFQEGDESTHGAAYLHELVPRGESVQGWTQMVTLTGARGMAQGDPGQDAMGFAQQLAAGYHAACPQTLTAVQLDAPQIAGARAVFAGYLGCGDNGAGQSEAMVFAVMVGAQDIYTLQWAEHGPVGAAPVFEAAHWYPRLAALAKGARICKLGEAAPYPSCTG